MSLELILASLFTFFILFRELLRVARLDNRKTYEDGFGPLWYAIFIYLWGNVIFTFQYWYVGALVGIVFGSYFLYLKLKNKTVYISYDPMEAFIGKHGKLFNTEDLDRIEKLADKYGKATPPVVNLFQLAPSVTLTDLKEGDNLTVVKAEQLDITNQLPTEMRPKIEDKKKKIKELA